MDTWRWSARIKRNVPARVDELECALPVAAVDSLGGDLLELERIAARLPWREHARAGNRYLDGFALGQSCVTARYGASQIGTWLARATCVEEDGVAGGPLRRVHWWALS